jgi:NAD(P)-dependent dehydrogenase (short-subunit alcohol dehydrogenase family)
VKGMTEQQISRPGRQSAMQAKPQSEKSTHIGSNKLLGKIALITGGDSGIGRAIAIAFAKEGASVAIGYLDEEKDAQDTKRLVEQEGGLCLLLPGDVGDPDFCVEMVRQVLDQYGRLDILVNNAAEQHPQTEVTAITKEQLERTFRTNVFATFYLTQAALPHLHEGSSILNTASVVAFKGHPTLLDYAATKGAIVAFTRSLALSLAEKKIRVNTVAPGPIWTPLIPSTFPEEKVEKFGKDTPLGRAGQPEEVAPAYVFLASDDASYITGQTIHVNGGSIVNA